MENNALTPEDRAQIERYNNTLDFAGGDEIECEAIEELFRALIRLKYSRPTWLTEDVFKVVRAAKEQRCHVLLYHLAPRLGDLGCDDWIIRLCIGTGPDVERAPSGIPRTSDDIAAILIENLLVHDVVRGRVDP